MYMYKSKLDRKVEIRSAVSLQVHSAQQTRINVQIGALRSKYDMGLGDYNSPVNRSGSFDARFVPSVRTAHPSADTFLGIEIMADANQFVVCEHFPVTNLRQGMM